MAVSNIIVKGIKPDLNILGNTQRFIFSDSTSYFGLRNDFVPTANIPSLVGFDFSNNSFSGFRFTYQTPFNQNLGSFKLKSYINNDPVGTDIFTVNNSTLTFNSAVDFAIAPLFNDPTQDLHAANKRYVDNHTWLVSSITNFDNTVRSYKLSDFLAPTENISLNNKTITNLANPINSSDAANRAFVDSKTWTTSQITNFNATVIAFRLDQFAVPNANLNLNSCKIVNLGTPTLATDATNKSYVDAKNWTASQITDFDTQVRLNRLDQMAIPTNSLNANSQKIINLAAPVLSTDGVNKNYSDTSTIAPSRISNFPNDSTKYLSGDGNWTTPAGGGGSGDTYQTLTSASSVTWNWANGNIALITLTTNVTLTITSGTATRGTLIVKQDAAGGKTLTLTAGIYRQGTTGGQISLTGTSNSIDVFQFFKDGSNNIYIWNAASQFVAIDSTPTNKYIFVYDGAIKTLTIPVSANNICRIKVLAAGGGQGIYNGGGSSGAGGYTIFQFNTTSYVGQEIKLLVGGGGGGGNYTSNIAGVGGYPNGGRGINGDTYCGGGGGRSDVRIGPNTLPFSASTIVAIAGGGGGGTGFSYYGGAGGGSAGQNAGSGSSTGGSQSSGGTSAINPPTQFQQAGFLQGAGATTNLINQGYDTGGGGDGYYGGGCSGGDGQASSGGSGYINSGFSGYVSSYGGYTSGTYQGNQTAIPTQASSDSDFNDGSGVGRQGASFSAGIGMNGGNGKIIVEFL